MPQLPKLPFQGSFSAARKRWANVKIKANRIWAKAKGRRYIIKQIQPHNSELPTKGGFWNFIAPYMAPDFRLPRKAFERAKRTVFYQKYFGSPKPIVPYTQLKERGSNYVEIFHDGSDAFEHMWKSFQLARARIWVSTYIWKDDVVGNRTLKELILAANRGVHVLVIYDDLGCKPINKQLFKELKRSGAHLLCWNKFKFQKTLIETAQGYFLHRHHRKLIVVDNDYSFIGGMNMSSDYCSKRMGGNDRFRDSHAIVIGPSGATATSKALIRTIEFMEFQEPHKYSKSLQSARLVHTQFSSEFPMNGDELPLINPNDPISKAQATMRCQIYAESEKFASQHGTPGPALDVANAWNVKRQHVETLKHIHYVKKKRHVSIHSGGVGNLNTPRDSSWLTSLIRLEPNRQSTIVSIMFLPFKSVLLGIYRLSDIAFTILNTAGRTLNWLKNVVFNFTITPNPDTFTMSSRAVQAYFENYPLVDPFDPNYGGIPPLPSKLKGSGPSKRALASTTKNIRFLTKLNKDYSNKNRWYPSSSEEIALLEPSLEQMNSALFRLAKLPKPRPFKKYFSGIIRNSLMLPKPNTMLDDEEYIRLNTVVRSKYERFFDPRSSLNPWEMLNRIKYEPLRSFEKQKYLMRHYPSRKAHKSPPLVCLKHHLPQYTILPRPRKFKFDSQPLPLIKGKPGSKLWKKTSKRMLKYWRFVPKPEEEWVKKMSKAKKRPVITLDQLPHHFWTSLNPNSRPNLIHWQDKNPFLRINIFHNTDHYNPIYHKIKFDCATHTTLIRPYQHHSIDLTSEWAPTTLYTSGKYGSPLLQQSVLELMDGAKETIYMTYPYFLPPKPISDAIIRASKRGVDVKILTAGRSDIAFMTMAAFDVYQSFLLAGVKLYELHNQELHAKFMTVDNKTVMIGSYNFDLLGFKHNEECAMVIQNPKLAFQVNKQFYEDLQNAGHVKLSVYWNTQYGRIITRLVRIVFYTILG